MIAPLNKGWVDEGAAHMDSRRQADRRTYTDTWTGGATWTARDTWTGGDIWKGAAFCGRVHRKACGMPALARGNGVWRMDSVSKKCTKMWIAGRAWNHEEAPALPPVPQGEYQQALRHIVAEWQWQVKSYAQRLPFCWEGEKQGRLIPARPLDKGSCKTLEKCRCETKD